MTVEELIDRLRDMPQDAVVVKMNGSEVGEEDVDHIESFPEYNHVVIY